MIRFTFRPRGDSAAAPATVPFRLTEDQEAVSRAQAEAEAEAEALDVNVAEDQDDDDDEGPALPFRRWPFWSQILHVEDLDLDSFGDDGHPIGLVRAHNGRVYLP